MQFYAPPALCNARSSHDKTAAIHRLRPLLSVFNLLSSFILCIMIDIVLTEIALPLHADVHSLPRQPNQKGLDEMHKSSSRAW